MADRWGLRIALALAAATALVLFGSIARAQDEPEPETPRLMTWDGERDPPELPQLQFAPCPGRDAIRPAGEQGEGVVFPSETAQCLLGRVQTLAELVPYVRLLEDRLRLSDERHALQTRAAELAVEQAEAAEGAVEAALRRVGDLEEQLNDPLRHPALWLALGAGIVVVLEVAAVLVFSEVVR